LTVRTRRGAARPEPHPCNRPAKRPGRSARSGRPRPAAGGLPPRDPATGSAKRPA